MATAEAAGLMNAPTQELPVVSTAGLAWRDVRLSREIVVEEDAAAPVSRTRLVLVFGMLAVTALATVVTLTRGSGRPAEPVVDLGGGAGGSAFGDGPGFGSTPRLYDLDVPPPPRPSAGPGGHRAPAHVRADDVPQSAGADGLHPGARTPAGGRGHDAAAAKPGAAAGGRGAPAIRGPAPGGRAVVEAEAQGNALGGGAGRVRRPGVFHGGAVVGLGRAGAAEPEGWVRFAGIRAPRPGQYAVTVY
jgi:hypothetical protein